MLQKLLCIENTLLTVYTAIAGPHPCSRSHFPLNIITLQTLQFLFFIIITIVFWYLFSVQFRWDNTALHVYILYQQKGSTSFNYWLDSTLEF